MDIYSEFSNSENYMNSMDLYENSLCLPSSTNLTETKVLYISNKLIEIITRD